MAIELAAVGIKILRPADLRNRLDERFRILTGGSRDALPRQRTLRALIDWSYELLDERERQLFRRIGVFADGCMLDAARAICGDADADELDILDVLASLVDKPLILAADSGELTRYRLLESTRMYAREALAASGESDDLHARHFQFFCAAVTSAERALETEGSDARFAQLTPDLENVRAALRYAATCSDAAARAALAAPAARLFSRLGLGAEAIRWLEAALESLEPGDTRLQSRIWSAIAFLVGNTGTGSGKSLEAAQRAVAFARQTDDRILLGWALTRLAVTAFEMRRRSDTEAALDEAEQLFGPDALPYQQARLLSVRVYIARFVGDHRAALAIGDALRTLYRRLGNTSEELMAMQNQAEDLHALSETTEAIVLAQEALTRAVATHDRDAHGFLQLNLAAYHAATGDVSAALTSGGEALELLAAGAPAGMAVATAIGHLALAHALRGETHRAARLLGYWTASWNASGAPLGFTERTAYEQLSSIVRERLDSDERAALFDAGAALSPQEAISEATRM